MALLHLLCLVVGFFSCLIDSIPTINAVGSKFFTSDGKQFFIKGVAYQLVEDDPLIDTDQCERDAALMQQLGANTIRVYHVNETADHSGCMNAFASRGIYLFVDLDSFKTYIRYADQASWTQEKATSYQAVMDNFQQYDNTAGFFVGNEVLNTQLDSFSAPFLLAAAADMKKYRRAKGYRDIPVGYSATDTGALRPMLQDYVVCRPDETERMDFYSINTYSWCGPATDYKTSGYPALQELSENYPIPIWMSEDGCNTVPPRTFSDQNAVFGPEMVDTWSGAMIYEWIQELNHYGLVSYGTPLAPDVNEGSRIVQGFIREGEPMPVQPDFDNLKNVWATLSPSGVQSASYAATFSAKIPECPAYTANGWSVDAAAQLPTIGAAGVSSGMASGVPTGSITVTGTSPPSTIPTITGQGTSTGQVGATNGTEPIPTSSSTVQSSAQETAVVGVGFATVGVLVALMAAAAPFVLFT